MEQIGQYKVLAHIGHGAMGSVEKAEAPDGTVVAIKTLFPQFIYNDEYVRRFKREAELARKLSHPNVVKIFEVGEDRDGRGKYIVMEYIDGKSLAEYMHDKGMASITLTRSSQMNEKIESSSAKKENTPKTKPSTLFSPEETIRIMRQIAGVLQAAADIGLLHRDVKPQNILLDKKGNVKLLDFGLAKDTESLVSLLSMTGQSIGTPPYMSPEQHDGHNKIDTRSDLYSLGCTAYHMLTGRPPFPGPTASAFARQHCDEIPEPVHKINPACPLNLSQVIDRLLAKNPAKRHQTPAELIEDLNRVERGEVPLKLYKPKKSRKHNPVRNWLTVAAAVIIVTGCFMGWDYYRKHNAVIIIKETISDARQMAVKHNFDAAKKLLDETIAEYAGSHPEEVKLAEALRLKLIEEQGKWLAAETERKRREQGTESARGEAERKRRLHNCLRNAARLKDRENQTAKAEALINEAYTLCNTDEERAKVAVIDKQVQEAVARVRPWAAVADFTLDKSVEVKMTGSAVAVKLEQALGPKYRLVTRLQMKKALDELRFQASDLADKSKAKRFGKLVGAEYLITGSVIQLGNEITVACQIFNIETGAIRQTAEVSAGNVNDFNYMIRDAAQMLGMSNSEKMKFAEKINNSKRGSGGEYPKIIKTKDKQIFLSDFIIVTNAKYAPLTNLAPGSREAQDRQKEWVNRFGLPLEVKTKNTDIEFRLIPPGTFTVGSPAEEYKRNEDEEQKQVTVTAPLYCGKFEITQGQWKQVMGTNPSRF
ncbi:MAG: protein kinase, partial [Victivallaceae bacterium]|nr:protein kinase [Victivallaceae bacterium]